MRKNTKLHKSKIYDFLYERALYNGRGTATIKIIHHCADIQDIKDVRTVKKYLKELEAEGLVKFNVERDISRINVGKPFEYYVNKGE